MATENVAAPTTASLPAVCFTDGMKIYQMHSEARTLDVEAHLSNRLAQLSALLSVVRGGGMSDPTLENTVWLAELLARECEELADALALMRRQPAAA